MLKIPVSPNHLLHNFLLLLLHLFLILCIILTSSCNYQPQASFVDSSTLTPSIALIVPQSFKVPTNVNGEQNINKLQQYVAIINNVQNDRNDQLLRQQYKKLSLQVRDAKSPITGQLFYEHVFDYFPPNPKQQHLLIPVNLDQVSPVNHEQHIPNAPEARRYVESLSSSVELISHPQHLYVSIRPHQLETGFGSDGIEFVSSAPVPVVAVPSSDGRRSFAVVQTDKPVYKPQDKVRIRSLVINEELRPITQEELRLQVKNPHKVVVEEIRFPNPNINYTVANIFGKLSNDEPLYLDYVFEFPPEPMLGTWTLHLLHNDPIANDTTSFEVKEYVLPPYEIEFNSPNYVLPGTNVITGSIVAKYHHGKPLQGHAQFKFGLLDNNNQIDFIARSSIKNVDQVTGRVDFKIPSDKFKEKDKSWFPHVQGYRLVVEATLTETATGHREIVQDTSCIFLTTPYRFSFDESVEDFKPGLSQQLTLQVLEMITNKPGPAGARIVAQYKDENNTLLGPTDSLAANNQPVDFRQMLDAEAFTDAEGRATFKVGPIRENVSTIRVELRLLNEKTQSLNDKSRNINTSGDLAIGYHELVRHESRNGWISLMNKTVSHANVGEDFISDILIRDAIVTPQKIYYTIVARGQIIDLKTLNPEGLVKFTITEPMIPSIRIVLFALSHDSVGLLSDSMSLNVGQNWECGLNLEYKSNLHDNVRETSKASTTFRPNDKGKLTIQARQGDMVSLIGVDSAVYTLNNRSRLSSSRIVERVRRLDLGCGFGGGKNNLDVFHNAGLMFFKNVFGSGNLESVAQNYLGSSCMTLSNQLKVIEDIQLGYARPLFSSATQVNRPRMLDLASVFRQRKSNNLSNRMPRNKREVEIESILRRYKDPMHKSCCRLGTLEDIPQRRNCSIRSRIVERYMKQEDFKYCSKIYLDCCRAVFGDNVLLNSMVPQERSEIFLTSSKIAPMYNEPKLVPSNIGHLEKIEAETLVRKDFRETWLFDLVFVDEVDGRASHEVKLPHSMTTWSISAMALNRNKPMCIMGQPLKITTFQEIFLHVSMPYKVVQGEQIDLVATVFNYANSKQEILVYMYGVEDVCSEAEPGERSDRKRIRIEKQSSQSVLFPMIPLKTGKFPVKILAVTTNASTSDIVERELNVVPRGKTVTDETTFSLDPMNQQRRNKRAIQTGNLVDEIDSSKGLQRTQIRLTPTRDSDNIVPQTQECIVNAIGDKMGQSVQTTMLDVENLIRLPHGCGEQVMIYLGPTLYTTRYLSSVNKLTGELRWRAIRYIQSGYKRVLNYRKENGAFSAFARRDPSIWLTAFIAKMLCQTERTPFVAEEIHVDKTVINTALEWLISEQDESTGTWIEMNPVYHREMLGGVLKENALTAFVTLSLNECAHHSSDLVEETRIDEDDSESANLRHAHSNGVDRLKLATQKAEQALMLDRYKAVKERNPYVLALTAYALSFSRPHDAAAVLNDLMLLAERSHARNQLYWKGYYPIETAAYALQALIELAPIVDASIQSTSASSNQQRSSWSSATDTVSIANWLSSRRSFTGAFESTQDTVVALEALSKLAQLQSSPSKAGLISSKSSFPTLMCNVTVSNRTRRSIEFGKDNAQVLQIFKLDSLDSDAINGEMVDIVTSGNGIGTMSVKYKYNVYQEEDELCRFDIDSSIEEWRPPKMSLNEVKNNQMQQDSDDNKDNQSNESIGDEFFKDFDKSMLSELNLINPNQLDLNMNKQQQKQTTAPKPVVSRNRELRLRRSVAEALESSSSSLRNASLYIDDWTTKVVSNLKAKLPTWLSPRTTTVAPSTTLTFNSADRFDTASYMSDATIRPRTNTTRRSTQGSSVPMIVLPGSIPADAKLNSLSTQIDIAQQNTTNSTTLHHMTIDPSNKLVLLLRICVRHMSQRDSGMAVLEIGILSGFIANEADLKEILNDVATPAMKYEISADKSLVIIYMQYIPFSGPYCIQFRLIRDSFVYNLQSGYIRAYEYYSPTYSCSNFYTPTRVTNLIETNCDSSGQVCQCASKSLCPATNKLQELGEVHFQNATSARTKLKELVCSNRYDLISMVRLKSVKNLQSGKMFKLSVKVRHDLKGNLSKIIEEQRLQKTQLSKSIRKPSPLLLELSHGLEGGSAGIEDGDFDENETSLDHLNMNIDSSCVRDDPMLLHFAHQNQWKQGGDFMVLFAQSRKLTKRYYKIAPKSTGATRPSYPRPTPNVIRGGKPVDNNNLALFSEDAQQFQYSTTLLLDKDTILHDLMYQAEEDRRKTIKDLIRWFEIRSKEICTP